MMQTKQPWWKRSVSMLLASAVCLGLGAMHTIAAQPTPTSMPEVYEVPIQSLESSAPISSIREGFSTVFGQQVTVTVGEDGGQTARLKTQHMVLQVFGMKYDANLTHILDADTRMEGIQEATVHTTKEEVYTSGMFFTTQKAITVPDELSIPLHLDEQNSQAMSIAVDYMNQSKGGGEPYPIPVTLTLDMEGKRLDLSPLKQLADRYRDTSLEPYSPETAEAFRAALAQADALVEQGADYEQANRCYQQLELAKQGLQYRQADYSQVDAALAKIPADASRYTPDSWAALEAARAQVVRGLDITQQSRVDGFAAALEQALSGLKTVEPELEKEPEPEKEPEVRQDGVYQLPVALWHASQDRASMAASALRPTARVVVKDGAHTVYLDTQPMTFGNLTASLQELKVQQWDGSWVTAQVERRGAHGDPVCFSFPLDRMQELVAVRVNPRVAMMGNQELDARLKFDLSQLAAVEEAQPPVAEPTLPVVEPVPPGEGPVPAGDEAAPPVEQPVEKAVTPVEQSASGAAVPATGDAAQLGLWAALLTMGGAGAAGVTLMYRRSGQK